MRSKGTLRIKQVKNVKNGTLQLVALGANLSSPDCSLEQTIADAIKSLAKSGFLIRAVSRFFSTPCFPVGAGPDYVNAAVVVQSAWNAADALTQLHRIEADFGRERVQRWGQRTLDLDLLAMGDAVLPDVQGFHAWYALDPSLQAEAAPQSLVLPHPRLQDRAFVLVPLADIAAQWMHPVLQKSVTEMLEALPTADVADVCAL